jgi:hypothetical protein
MNSLIKISAVGSLALGGVAAHAAIVVPTSSNKPGDVLLFADIFNGTTLVDGYVGDTQVTVDSVVGGKNPGNYLASGDSALSAFLGEATAGTTVLWSVLGGGFKSGGTAAEFVTTSSTNKVNGTNGGELLSWVTGLNEQVNTINGFIGTATSTHTTNISTTSGIGYNPPGLVNDASNWWGGNQPTVVTGLGSSATLFAVTAAGQGGINTATATPEFTVSLTSSGLTYTAISTVPLPAAVWLLGSGLLGLVGVARRKIAA